MYQAQLGLATDSFPHILLFFVDFHETGRFANGEFMNVRIFLPSPYRGTILDIPSKPDYGGNRNSSGSLFL